MTVYDLLRELIEYPADADVTFTVGPLGGSNCNIKQKDSYYDNRKFSEVYIEILD